ncbi:hypothetical protein AAHH80_33625, partial [Burkholderia pseudomallei]
VAQDADAADNSELLQYQLVVSRRGQLERVVVLVVVRHLENGVGVGGDGVVVLEDAALYFRVLAGRFVVI